MKRHLARNISLPEDVWAVIEAEARAQQRTVSNMVLVYLTSHAAVVPGIGIAKHPGNRKPRQTKGLETALAPEEVPVRKRGRQVTCPHSIPASMKCLVCDD